MNHISPLRDIVVVKFTMKRLVHVKILSINPKDCCSKNMNKQSQYVMYLMLKLEI